MSIYEDIYKQSYQAKISATELRIPKPKIDSVHMTDRSSLTKNLNMVSSDTIKDKNAPQNPRIRTNTNSRMNKPANEELTNFKHDKIKKNQSMFINVFNYLFSVITVFIF